MTWEHRDSIAALAIAVAATASAAFIWRRVRALSRLLAIVSVLHALFDRYLLRFVRWLTAISCALRGSRYGVPYLMCLLGCTRLYGMMIAAYWHMYCVAAMARFALLELLL